MLVVFCREDGIMLCTQIISFLRTDLMIKTQKIRKTTLSDQVCRIIKEKIKNKDWTEGSKIPSENELAEAFGVNRLTVRNALQKLNAMGIVETKAGEGTFVRKFDFSEYVREVSDLVLSPEMLDGVMEFRKCIELECIKLGLERAGTADFTELEAALDTYERTTKDMSKPSEEHIHAIIESDLEFHYQLCKLSKNSLFTLAFAAVREPMYQYIRSVLIKRYNRYVADAEQGRFSDIATHNHRAILEAIQSGNYEACEKAYLNVIDYKNLK